jgi:protein-disulfide isomerase
MENERMTNDQPVNDEQWVKQRLRVLDPSEAWLPQAGAAFAGLQRRDRRRRSWQRGWIWSTAMASACVIVLFVLPAPAKCALAGVGCPRPLAASVLLAPAAVTAKQPAPVAHYKESGSPDAPVTCEIYSDYECPSCAYFYTTVFPQLVTEYVKTGKVRIVHRDFPLPQHPHSKLAARYANAAGELGHYDEVVSQLFGSQPEWAANGNIDAAVAHVLTPDTMRKLRVMVESDPALDATVAADLAIVAREQINQTPTLLFVYKGVRRKVAGPPSFDLLRSYIQEMLRQ